jgi:hypothetical protein
MDSKTHFDDSIKQALQQTERYYREQIFSSGCSSLVPIYRIHDSTKTIESLRAQLDGSPYIQKEVNFSERIISSLMDVELYCYKDYHFFFNGDVHPDLETFIENECTQLESFANILQGKACDGVPKWLQYLSDLAPAISAYPVLKHIDLDAASGTLSRLLGQIKLAPSIETHLNILCNGEYHKLMTANRAAMCCMILMGQNMGWPDSELRQLILLSVLKDVGYTRIDDDLSNFEIMHPLVSHKLLDDAAMAAETDDVISADILNSVLVHHEFIDGTGPLARMRHPSVTQILSSSTPAAAQISGICDLYFGFLNHYSEGLAYSLTQGFVVGQGDVLHRYEPNVVDAFTQVLRRPSFELTTIEEEDAKSLIKQILDLFHIEQVKQNTHKVIMAKGDSWFDRITLAMNIVRNIANKDPKHLKETSFVKTLKLPMEFGLNY